jgi:hypothetical protein
MNPTGEQLKKIMDVVVEEAEHTELDLRIKRAKDYHGELWERKPITSPAIEHNQKFEFYDNLDFGKALDAMKRGHKVRRANWKYKQIYLLEGQIRYYLTEGDNDIVEYYNPYSDDILAEDWEILTEDIVAITK